MYFDYIYVYIYMYIYIYIYIYTYTIIWREYRGEKYAGHQRFYARKVYLLFDVLNVFCCRYRHHRRRSYTSFTHHVQTLLK